jgi:putative ABC transport system ATP-binding protein
VISFNSAWAISFIKILTNSALGEKQRVAIARALAGNPPILLADEPTASLDAKAGKNICEILRNQVNEHGRTVVVVSHDPRWREFADRTITLCDGQVEQEVKNS